MRELKNNPELIKTELLKIFPNPKCELEYSDPFTLLIAVCLSAQTTDKRVNEVTPALFKKYPDCMFLSKANIEDVIEIIKPLGMANQKAKNIINLSKSLVNNYNSLVPNNMDDLITLPGCGRKTANVILSIAFNIPSIAVDTHVSRVSNRLDLSNEIDPIKIEKDLQNIFDQADWSMMHHLLLLFGRYICKAKKPDCIKCPFRKYCIKNND